jgi:uncharacterized protein (TIGR01777 family)
MRVAVTGATGTIGTAIARALRERGDDVVAVSRDARRAARRLGDDLELREWPDPTRPPAPDVFAGTDAVVHMLGEPLAQRWTADAKRRIRDSRVLTTRALVDALGGLPAGERPQTLLSQSATGYYGPLDARPLDESAPAGDGFLADVVVAWEREAAAAESYARVVRLRTGVVLSPEGGAISRMLPFFRLAIGGPVAGGRQYVPWVHLEDVAGAVLHCLDHGEVRGAVNVTAPEPATNAELSRALGRALHRPAVMPVPAFALRLLYGEMAQIVTTGQRVLPARLRRAGYVFRHPSLDAALQDVLKRSG